MSLNSWSAFRIAVLLLVATGCAWGAGQYLDARSFHRHNADAIAVCGTLTPGMPVAQAESRSHAVDGAVVTPVNGNLVIRIPGQSLCFVEMVDGHVRSATVARND
jgi:hypothetical protein